MGSGSLREFLFGVTFPRGSEYPNSKDSAILCYYIEP